MSQKDTPLQIANRATDAARLIANPVFQYAIAAMRTEIVDGIANLHVNDRDSIQLGAQQLKIVDRLAAKLAGLVRAGDAAEQDRKRDAAKRLREDDDRIEENPLQRGMRAVQRG